MKIDKNSKLPANAGKPWDDETDKELFKLLRQHKSQRQIANKLERTEDDVFWRVADLLVRHAPSVGL